MTMSPPCPPYSSSMPMPWKPASDNLSQSSKGYSSSRRSKSRAQLLGASASTQRRTESRKACCSSDNEKSMVFLQLESQTAVDDDGLTGDIGRFLGCQKRHGFGDFLRLAEALERYALALAFPDLGSEQFSLKLLAQSRVDDAGGHHVRADTVTSLLPRNRAAQHFDCRLRHRRQSIARGKAISREGPDGHDRAASLLPKQGYGRTHDMRESDQFRLDDVIPLL